MTASTNDFTQRELTDQERRSLLRRSKLAYARRGRRRGFMLWAEQYTSGYLPADTVPALRIAADHKVVLCQHLEQYDTETSFVLLRIGRAGAASIETWSAAARLFVEVEDTVASHKEEPCEAI